MFDSNSGIPTSIPSAEAQHSGARHRDEKSRARNSASACPDPPHPGPRSRTGKPQFGPSEPQHRVRSWTLVRISTEEGLRTRICSVWLGLNKRQREMDSRRPAEEAGLSRGPHLSQDDCARSARSVELSAAPPGRELPTVPSQAGTEVRDTCLSHRAAWKYCGGYTQPVDPQK
jgi:hypothetical protein